MKKYSLYMCAILCALAPVVQARTLNLSEIFKISLDKSPEVQIQINEIQSKLELSEAAGVWRNPEVSLERETKKDPNSNETVSTKIGVSQTLAAYGKFATKSEAAKAEVDLEKINLSEKLFQTKTTVLQLVFEYLADVEKAKHAEERHKRFKSVYTYLKNRTFASPQKRTEASIVSSKLMILQKELDRANSEVQVTWNKLNYFLGLKERPEVKLNWFFKTPKLTQDAIFDKAKGSNFQIQKFLIENKRLDLEVDFAKKDIWPEVTIHGSIGDGSGFAPEKTYALGLSAPIPLFSKNKSLVNVQSLKMSANQKKLSSYKDYLPSLIESSLIRYQVAQRTLEQLPIGKINDIEKDFEIADQGFRKGLVDLVTYLEADSQHFEAITAIYNTQVEFAEIVSELSVLTGEFVVPVESL